MTKEKEHPSFTVVVCVYNRPQALASCLVSLSAMDETSFEVLVVDDGSTDETPAVIEESLREFRRSGPGRTAHSLRTEKRRGVSAARNLAIDAARGDVVCFTDSDCTVATNWLSALRAALEDPSLAAVSGKVRNGPPRNLFEQVHHAITDPGPKPRPDFLSGNNMAFRRGIFRDLRFDETIRYYADETDFGRRLFLAGHALGFTDEAVTFHHHAMNFRHLMTTARLQGIGSAGYARRHHAVVLDVWPPLLAVAGLVLAVMDGRWLLLTAAAVLAHLAMLARLGRNRWGLSWAKLVQLTPIFSAYYVCRSYGFFFGTLAKRITGEA